MTYVRRRVKPVTRDAPGSAGHLKTHLKKILKICLLVWNMVLKCILLKAAKFTICFFFCSQVQMLQEQVGHLAESQATTDDRYSKVKQENATLTQK